MIDAPTLSAPTAPVTLEPARAIPRRGHDRRALLEAMQALGEDDADWRSGRTFSLIYDAGQEHQAFLHEAHALFAAENGLNPLAFKSLKRMEAEVVRMSATLLGGDEQVVGTMTSGGTESILLACKAARDRARAKWPWIRRPEILAPDTIHVAFDKAAKYFGLRLRRVPVGPDKRANVRAMRRRIGRNTVLIAASAPQYPHGVVDPIEQLAAVARERNVPFHVDACVGGFMLPWLERLGRPVRPWDFRVPGVTSISADLHKYGYAAKGASVVLYRDMSYLRYQFHVTTDWPGGVYASPTIAGTRPGGAISAAWATLQALGEDGYLELARKALQATDALRAGIAAIPELELIGEPDMTIVTYGARDADIDVFALGDRLEERGWNVDRQQGPPSIHCTVTAGHVPHIDAYLADLREAVAYLKAHPEARKSGSAPMYGLMAKMPARGLVKRSVLEVMEKLYGPEGQVDLTRPGGEDAGPLMRLMDKHGDRVLDLLGKLETARARLRGALTPAD